MIGPTKLSISNFLKRKKKSRNRNRIITDDFSNPDSLAISGRWPDEPEVRAIYEENKQCGGCSFYAPFNSDFGLCCHPGSRHHLETVFEHFTCASYAEEGWEAHSFLTIYDRERSDDWDKKDIAICDRVSAYVAKHDLGIVTDRKAKYLLSEKRPPFSMDLGFISRNRSINMTGDCYALAPYLAMKIVTSFDRADLLQYQLLMFLEAGTRQVWVVYDDYRDSTVVCNWLTPDLNFQAKILTLNDTLDGSDVLPGFIIPVKAVFDRRLELDL